jgi:hypothetical protein
MNTKKKIKQIKQLVKKNLSKRNNRKNEHMKKKIWSQNCKKTKKNNTRSQNYEKAEKYISFGSLKTNTELPVQRWWFKSTPKPRTVIFFNVSYMMK